nr:immunoglobulin heavy chain junction region [Mus musculus]MBK4184280.1 immunoglobulin heavy chain junction region [Mus musculus]
CARSYSYYPDYW